MTTFDTKSLKKESRDRLNRISGDPRLLIGLYTGVIVATDFYGYKNFICYFPRFGL